MLRKIKVFTCFIMFYGILFSPTLVVKAEDSPDITYKIEKKTQHTYSTEDSLEEQIAEENRLGEMELISQLVMAEAGNQDLTGKRYVVDVVLNRVDSDKFPNSVEEVIFQDNQFSVMKDGGFEKAAWTITDDCFEAVELEYEKRLNHDILYFGVDSSEYASHHFKHQDHWFGW